MPVTVFDVTTGFAGLIVIVTDPVPVPLIFVAVIVTVVGPAVVGVPLITPVVVLNDKPAGYGVAV